MLAASSVFGAFAETHTLDINTRKAGAAVSPTMYGIFFEDINYAADGGLYGELVKNRSFEFPQALLGWQAFGNVEVKADGPFERCPHYVVLGFTGHKECATRATTARARRCSPASMHATERARSGTTSRHRSTRLPS